MTTTIRAITATVASCAALCMLSGCSQARPAERGRISPVAAIGADGGHVSVKERAAPPGLELATVSSGRPTIHVSPGSTPTLAQVLRSAPAGAIIHLAPGSYPQIDDTAVRSGWVTLTGAGDAQLPTIHGAQMLGSRYLRVVDVRLTSSFVVNRSPVQHHPAADIALINSEIDCGTNGSLIPGVAHGDTGVLVRGGASGVSLIGDDVHNCMTGFGSVAQDPMSSDISILHSRILGFSGDAMDLGGLRDVNIQDDAVGGADHSGPESLYHDDAIQFYGNTADVTIADNVLENSGGQLLFIQNAIKSKVTGSSTNQGILVENNLIFGANAYAVQDQGGQDVRFINNTMWDNHFGSLIIRRGYSGVLPTETVVLNNIIEGFSLDQAAPTVLRDNIIDGLISPVVRAAARRGGNLLDVNPRFVDPDDGGFALQNRSPAAGRGASVSVVRSYAGIGIASFEPGHAGTTNIGVFQPDEASRTFGPVQSKARYHALAYG